jgi:fucose permease
MTSEGEGRPVPPGRKRRMSPNAGVVGSLILMVLGVVIIFQAAGTDLVAFGWLLVLVGAASVIGNLAVAARSR